jgi:hypothetical protein
MDVKRFFYFMQNQPETAALWRNRRIWRLKIGRFACGLPTHYLAMIVNSGYVLYVFYWLRLLLLHVKI